MTGTDFSADRLMRRDVTGGNNQGNAVASLHMTIMMNRISTVADRQTMVRKVKHGKMTGMPAKDTIKLPKKVIQFTDAGEVTGNLPGEPLLVIIRPGVKPVTRVRMRTPSCAGISPSERIYPPVHVLFPVTTTCHPFYGKQSCLS